MNGDSAKGREEMQELTSAQIKFFRAAEQIFLTAFEVVQLQ